MIVKFVLDEGFVPLNPFNLWDYFLTDSVDRDVIRNANNAVVERCDEVWVFGDISDGVLAEINLAMELKKPLKFYSAGKNISDIKALSIDNLTFENEVEHKSTELKRSLSRIS